MANTVSAEVTAVEISWYDHETLVSRRPGAGDGSGVEIAVDEASAVGNLAVDDAPVLGTPSRSITESRGAPLPRARRRAASTAAAALPRHGGAAASSRAANASARGVRAVPRAESVEGSSWRRGIVRGTLHERAPCVMRRSAGRANGSITGRRRIVRRRPNWHTRCGRAQRTGRATASTDIGWRGKGNSMSTRERTSVGDAGFSTAIRLRAGDEGRTVAGRTSNLRAEQRTVL